MPLFHVKLEDTVTTCRVTSKIEAQHIRLRSVHIEAQAPAELGAPHDFSGYLVDLSDMFTTTTKEITSQSTHGAKRADGSLNREPHSRLHIPINTKGETKGHMHLNCGFDSHTLSGEWKIKVFKDMPYGTADMNPSWGTGDGQLTSINLYFEYETNDNQH